MIKTILVDDERHALESLKLLLNKLFPEKFEFQALCLSVDQAIPAIEKHQPDLVFLDIQMPQKNGFALLEVMPNREFDVIFTTAYRDHAIHAIKNTAFDYLLKPIDSLELQKTIIRYLDSKKSDPIQPLLETLSQQLDGLGIIAFSTSDGMEFLKLDEIIYLEADRNYTTIFLENNRKLLISKALGQIETKLPESRFIRIHQSYSVNVTKILRYDKAQNFLIMKTGEKLSVAIRKNSTLTKRFA
ncbi:LytR/AlgR family response regulator transcription factor [Algoriphagus hitonicola]|uniref:Two component transcriptional regulator, LytTR family n=1 Tax=Algoriphagus hitonicola TaxID=435880 RepID=A0A1I2VSH7_9BACT|nr:LytTR family DNA-binding domain-containing protein [Algoriphagus hitonicola]SFG90466.1 two component transcriptional regulator, LytTR family [Algoriphagus hitonicola]